MNEYISYRLAAILCRLFPEKLAYWFGLRIADVFYARNQVGREGIISNLKRIYAARGVIPAEASLAGLSRKTFQYFGKYLIDFFRYARLTPEEVRQRVCLERLDYLERCVALKRGVLVLTAHFGNWELGAAAVTALGYKVNALVLPARLEKLNRMFQKQREKRGVKLIPVDRSAVLGMIRCLKNGEIVAVLGDRDFTGKDDRVEFFGEPARVPRGPAWLSMKSGAPILPAFLMRQVDDTFLLRFHPPIFPEQEGSVEAIRSRTCRVLEKEIGEQPYQWFIFDDFWANNAPAAKSKGGGLEAG
jgi:phosphatidylinositol dimannoside acyltransferase